MPDHTIDLSILVCGVHTRRNSFLPKIQDQLYGQLEVLPLELADRVEIIVLTDNKQMMLGDKRNVMVDIARGRYVVFVDDDDRVSDDYVASLLEATASNSDVIVFHAEVSLNGDVPKICRYSKDFRRDRNTATEYHRIPNHICCVKRDLARKVSFPSIPKGEDAAYARLLLRQLRTEHKIDRVLYFYDYSAETTEAQTKVSLVARRRDLPPLVDVVILSKATDRQAQRMTQHTVNSCIAGANALPVSVTVVEQSHGASYTDVALVRNTGEFHYNRFANEAIALGSAEWVMVANNDLDFSNGWLHHLLEAGRSVVCPRDPGDPRQFDVVENTWGFVNGRHFSGWCFMMKRSVWEMIGHLDESVSFWCSDDVVIEQLREWDLPPMLVAASHVRHLGSKTLKRTPTRLRDEMTWGQVHIFNERFGQEKFADDPRYQAWKRRHG